MGLFFFSYLNSSDEGGGRGGRLRDKRDETARQMDGKSCGSEAGDRANPVVRLSGT